jgi:hypothetical protein
MRLKDLPKIQLYYQVAHFKLQQLFCLRQRFFNSNKKNTDCLKPHACCHIVPDVPLYGCPQNNDTALYENMHIKYAKEAFRSSSRRDSVLLPEMTKKIQLSRLIRCLGARRSEPEMEKFDEEVMVRKTSQITHRTVSDVIYKCTSNSNCRDELIWRNETQSLYQKFHGDSKVRKVRFKNPNVSFKDIMTSLESYGEENDSVNMFLEQFKDAVEGIIIQYCIFKNALLYFS